MTWEYLTEGRDPVATQRLINAYFAARRRWLITNGFAHAAPSPVNCCVCGRPLIELVCVNAHCPASEGTPT